MSEIKADATVLKPSVLKLLQGLRTLELCVDNLQPDFLYDHIQPVRAELMQVTSLFVYIQHTYNWL